MDTSLTDLGHEVDHNMHKQTCIKCSQTWTKATRADIIDKGLCPGLGSWDNHRMPEIPRRYVGSSAMMWAGREIHISHSIHYLKGIIFCIKCGALSQGRFVQKLAQPCLRTPANDTAYYGLKRMKDGRHPEAKGKFPTEFGKALPPPKWLEQHIE